MSTIPGRTRRPYASIRGVEGDKSAVASKVGVLLAERAKAAGITKVVFDRCGNRYMGRIAALASNRLRDGMVGGEDLTPLKARILLMLALTKTQSATEIQRMFTEY